MNISETKSVRIAYGEALLELGGTEKNLVVLDADLAHATMTCKFGEAYPKRFFNMGIAEGDMMDTAAGLAISGFTPVASTFALFGTGRAYEQIRNSICYPKLNVKIACTHSGLTVGEDGGSHQSIEDISLMRSVPNMTVIVPCDAVQMKKALTAAVEMDGPVYLRVSRPPAPVFTKESDSFEIGKANILRNGSDIAIFATGLMVYEALVAAEELENQGVHAAVVDMHTIKPIDKESIISLARKTKRILTVEEHSVIGGLGSAVAEVLSENMPTAMKCIGIEDCFGQSGTPEQLLKEYGLSSANIVEQTKIMIKKA
jgi:transketolase